MACVFGCSCCFLRVVGLGKIRNLDLGGKIGFGLLSLRYL